MTDINIDSLIQVLGVVAFAVITVFVGVQKLLKDWRSNNAETSVITIMHTELERMSVQNSALSVELGRLHNEVITLNKQLQRLTLENQRLQTEVVALTKEVSTFKQLTQKESHGKI